MSNPSKPDQPSLPEDVERYGKHYNESDFWKKLQGLPRSAVGLVLEKALLLRELLVDGATPLWVKGTILGALGYLILPIDLVPDFLPGVGFVDDIAAMSLVLANLGGMVTDEIRQRAKRRMPPSLLPEGPHSAD